LAKDQVELRRVLLAEAARLGYCTKLYQQEPKAFEGRYTWLGHSLGCKYIALLEVLSDLDDSETVFDGCIGSIQSQEIQTALKSSKVSLEKLLLKGQSSLLIAPVISDLGGAVPIPALARFVRRYLRIDVLPKVEQTHCLITKSQLFNLTGLIGFTQDQIAGQTVEWFKPYLVDKKFGLLFSTIQGRHLAPLGFLSGNPAVAYQVLQFLVELRQRA